ncbi:GWxTD domain-containing protein [Gemmatimonas sp.]|uniref:GWxTD domain-containing protein n=1 Tax=Gemmatimonas sp. TaxID=1962908 RepID=UPI0033414B79
MLVRSTSSGLRRLAKAVLAILCTLSGPALLPAQAANDIIAPWGAAAGTPAARADSLAAAGDTARALAVLDSAVRRNPRDGVAWYYQGMYLWAQTGLKMRPNVFPSQKMVRMVAAADSSLRLAVEYAPDSARYFVSLGRFTLKSGYPLARAAGRMQTNDGVKAAERTGDLPTLAAASDIVGMFAWRNYEAFGNRGLSADGRRVSLTGNDNFQRKDAADVISSFLKRIEPPTGTDAYNEALARFRVAVGADSTNLRFSRHLYMTLAAKDRWEELLSVASYRRNQFPLDYQARLACGLALHRLRRFADAKVAFDSALAIMDDEEASRMTRFTRLLRPKSYDKRSPAMDSTQFTTLPPEQRRGLEAMYWLMNDPLTLTAENELQLEFLARVTYADFRWTDEEMDLRGADTDRGDIYVRYGPPKVEITSAGNTFTTSEFAANATIIWEYPEQMFFFDLVPSFNTAKIGRNDQDFVNRLRDAVPASFNNLPITTMMDTIPMRIARFRARGDSLDAVVAARVPLDSLVRNTPLDRVPVDFDFRIFDQFVRVQGMESTQGSYAPDSAAERARRTWTKRLGPGINVVRVEALQADTRRAARGTVRLMPVPTSGFGMSDVLLGSKPSLVAGKSTAASWQDVEIAPSEGVLERGATLGLVWELYELTAKDGNGKYRVAISVERAERGGPLGFGFKALDGLGRALGRENKSPDKFTISFDRTAAATATLVEYLSLDMSAATAGRYRLRVEISDLGSGKRVSRDTEFFIK